MKKTNVFTIKNNTSKDVVLWPHDNKFAEMYAIFVRAHTLKMIDYTQNKVIIDLDETYFQFANGRKKIKVEDINKYGVELEFQLL